MKKLILLLSLSCSLSNAQQEFVRGIYTFGNPYPDFFALRDSLHLNWVQAEVERWDGWIRNSVVQNSAGLSIMGVMANNIYPRSQAQRMVFNATQGVSDSINYFAYQSGVIAGQDLYLTTPGSAQTMVKNAHPDNEYRYDIRKYRASFVLKCNTSGTDTDVVRLKVRLATGNPAQGYDSLLVDSPIRKAKFTPSQYDTFRVDFELPDSPLWGDEHHVDFQVDWCGYVETWFRSVIVEEVKVEKVLARLFDYHDANPMAAVGASGLFRPTYLYDDPRLRSSSRLDYSTVNTMDAYEAQAGEYMTSMPDWCRKFIFDGQSAKLVKERQLSEMTRSEAVDVFPNPFNPLTTVTYTLTESSFVLMEIFDGLGRKVAQPVNAREPTGIWSVSFDGSQLPSGSYYLNVLIGEKRHVRRLMLLK